MVRRLMNYLRGSVWLRIHGPFPERFLNLCGANGVPFWRLHWEDDRTLTLRVPRRRWKLALELAERGLCTAEELGKYGAPESLSHLRRRYAFLAGLLCAMTAALMLSHVVLVIEVTGNETVPDYVIIEELAKAGLKFGSFTPAVPARSVAHRVLLADERLCYMAVNLHGVRAEIVVRETDPAPEVVDEDAPAGDVVAECDGVVERIEPLVGQAAVAVGDTVVEGDVLISRTVTLIHPRTLETVYTTQVHARGNVYARTWYTISAACPLDWQEKVDTQREKTRRRLIFFTHSLKFYRKSSISDSMCDKIDTVKQLTLPGGIALPVRLVTQHSWGYQTQPVTLNVETEQARLERSLLYRLYDLIGDDGEVRESNYTADTENGVLTVTMTAECLEEIGRQSP